VPVTRNVRAPAPPSSSTSYTSSPSAATAGSTAARTASSCLSVALTVRAFLVIPRKNVGHGPRSPAPRGARYNRRSVARTAPLYQAGNGGIPLLPGPPAEHRTQLGRRNGLQLRVGAVPPT